MATAIESSPGADGHAGVKVFQTSTLPLTPPESTCDRSRADRLHAENAAAVGIVQVVLTLGVGGTERLVVEICQRLRSRFRMAVCTLEEPGAWAHCLQERGIEVVPLRRRPGFHPWLGYRIAQVARRHQASVIHCHHYSPFVYGAIATRMWPGRMVFTEHGRLSDGPPSLKRRIVNPILGRLPGSLFAVSRALRDSMIDEGFPADRLEVIHNGIDPGLPPTDFERRSARRRLGILDTTLVVGTIARLDAVKDLGTLIEAIALLRQSLPDVVLVVVGDGDERRRLKEIARRCGVQMAVNFFGQRNDARRLLPAFDAYVNSSTSEGVSLTILEAMAAGLPVVATRVGGTPEILTDGLTGLLVPARSPATVARALRRLAGDPAQRRALGSAARLAVERSFTIDRMVEDYAQVYLRQAG